MVWLTSRPEWLLVIGCLVIAVVVGFGSRLLALAFIPPSEREEAHSIAAAMMTAFAAAFVLLTALTLANEATSLTSAQNIVSTEAADASSLAWASTNPGVNTEPIQVALRNYLHEIRVHEWHGIAAANGDDAATDNSLAALERTVRNESVRPRIGISTSNELLTNLDAMTTQRRLQLAAASRSLPVFYVVLVIATGLALIVNSSVVATRGGRRAALVPLSLIIVIALSVALLFTLATPWRGAIGVSGHPIDSVITDLKIGYFHR
jgi:hypothetical protein